MSTFFKALSLLMIDRQEFRLTAKKINEDLVLTIVPDFKGKGKIHNITVPADDLNDEIDSKIFGVIGTTAPAEPAKFQHTETDAPEKDDDDDDEDEKKEKKNAPAKKSAPAKKTPEKKVKAKKPAPKKEPVKKEVAKPVKKEETAKVEADPEPEHQEITEVDFEEPTVQDNQPEPEPIPEPEPEPGTTVDDVKVEEPVKVEKPKSKELVKEKLAAGQQFYADRKYKDMLAAYEGALALDPDSKEAAQGITRAQSWIKAVEKLNLTQTT